MTSGRSFRYEWEVALRDAQLGKTGTTAALVGFVLATYANADGSRIFPGEDRVAAGLGVSVSTVQRAMRMLRDLGYITRTRGGNSRAGQAAEWRLTLPAHPSTVPCDPKPSATDHTSNDSDRTSLATYSPVAGEVPPAQNHLILTNSSPGEDSNPAAPKKNAWARVFEEMSGVTTPPAGLTRPSLL